MIVIQCVEFQALTGCNVSIQTLDNRELNIPVNEIITHGYQKKVSKCITRTNESFKRFAALLTHFGSQVNQFLLSVKNRCKNYQLDYLLGEVI